MLHGLGDVHLTLGEADVSLASFRRAVELFSEVKHANWEAYARLSITECLISLG